MWWKPKFEVGQRVRCRLTPAPSGAFETKKGREFWSPAIIQEVRIGLFSVKYAVNRKMESTWVWIVVSQKNVRADTLPGGDWEDTE